MLNSLNDRGYLGYNDPYLTIDNIKVTHDKINSLIDFDIIKKIPTLHEKSSNNVRIIEIGAGSARTSETILTFYKNINYVICDIPLAIIIAYKRLKKSFPNKKISTLFDINDEKELKKSILENEISFIFPHQMSLIKDKFFDLTLAIDCLHEMKKIQVEWYFDQFDRLSKNLFFKCQNIQWAIFEKNKYNIDNYPVKNNWSKVIHKKCYIPNGYFQAIYKIN